MARPYKPRTAEDYGRVIHQLTQLRAAIVVDETIESDESADLQLKIDSLVSALIVLKRKMVQ